MSLHEAKDVTGRSAAYLIGGALVFFFLLIALAAWFFAGKTNVQAERYQSYSLPDTAIAPRPGAWTEQDLERYREREQTLLSTYAWVDADRMHAEVPIDRAIDLAVQRKIFENRDRGQHVH